MASQTVDCSEITVDEQLSLAATISDAFEGRAIAFVKNSDLVLDAESKPPSMEELSAVIRGFISRRKDSIHYSFEVSGDRVVVHSADPLARSRGRKKPGLPDNLLKCPFCSFVTPYQEAYDVHFRSHGAAL